MATKQKQALPPEVQAALDALNAVMMGAKDFAELKGCSTDAVRTAIRNGSLPGEKVHGKVMVLHTTPKAQAWEPNAGARTTREDGRKKYYGYFTPEELAYVKDALADVGTPAEVIDTMLVDPRKKDRARAAKRKAKKVEAPQEVSLDTPEAAENPFADFGK